jgi:hypothetical protein
MDEQQDYEIEELAQNFSEALIAAHQLISQGYLIRQTTEHELTQRFCNIVVSYLDVRAAHVFANWQEGLEQAANRDERVVRPGEPAPMPELEPVESVGTYMDLMNSIVAAYMRSHNMTGSYPWDDEAVQRFLRKSPH